MRDIIIFGIDQSASVTGLSCLFYKSSIDKIYLVVPKGFSEEELMLSSFTVKSTGITKKWPTPVNIIEEFKDKLSIVMGLYYIKLSNLSFFDIDNTDLFCALESVFVGKNKKSALSLIRIQTAAAMYFVNGQSCFGKIIPHEVNNKEAKSSVGAKDKDSVTGSVNNLFDVGYPNVSEEKVNQKKHDRFGHITDAVSLSYSLMLNKTNKIMTKGTTI